MMKDRFMKFLVLVPGLMMLSNAVMFVLSPADAAGDLGMPLLEGIGLSTQLADLGAFFTFSALLIFYGVLNLKGEYLRITALLLGLAAILRVIAWGVNGAAFATELIVAEIVLVIWLLVGAVYIDKFKSLNGVNH
jgi:hypothetical protein